MWRPSLMAIFAVLAGPSLSACQLQLGCDPDKCSSDCPEKCPNGIYGSVPDTFVPPTPPASCPLDADRICADGYLYSCTKGKVSSKYIACTSGTFCTETVTRDGRRGAACWTGADPCTSDAPASAECRDNDRVACEYGLVTFRSTCTASMCAVSTNGDGEPIASCVVSN